MTITADTEKKLSDTKNELKKKNRALNELKITSNAKELEMVKENDDLTRELERSKKKAHELLKNSYKY